MDVREAIEARRAVKEFDPHYQMEEREVKELMRLAMLSPTAFNIQNWRFVLVRDKALRQEIRKIAWDQAQVTDASLLVILCANLKSWEQQPCRYWSMVPPEIQEIILPKLDEYYRGKPQVQRDEAMRSCGIAAQTLMLAAKEMGYDSCPMDGFDFEAVGRLIKLPEDHVIAMFVAIGKRIKEPWPRGGKLSMEEVVIENGF